MKYVLSSALMAIALMGCTATAPHTAAQANISAASSAEVIHFVGPMDLTVTLASSDNFATATMTDNADRSFQLHRIDVPNGVRMANAEGVFIHFNRGEGIVQFVQGKPIDLREFKQP